MSLRDNEVEFPKGITANTVQSVIDTAQEIAKFVPPSPLDTLGATARQAR